jgi:hypothetical protein
MKPFALLSAFVSTVALSIAPAMARVDAGTPGLLREVQESGLTVALNPRRCIGAAYLGSYHSGTRVLTVCYNGRPSAGDHDTVRHEVFHAAQHCAAVKRGYGNTVVPILRGNRLTHFVNQNLTPTQIRRIRSSYPHHKHATELEAFAASNAYSAREIGRIYRTWCR